MEDALLTRTIPLAGRRVKVSAPAGDYALSRYTTGRTFSDFALFCRAHLRSGGTVLDVGANIGLSSLVAARVLGAERVLAVEASARNCVALRRNFSTHGLDPADVVHAAAGATEGTVAFHQASAFGHVVTAANMAGHGGDATPLQTLDAIVAAHALTRVDFIKLDVEGFEQQALEGAEGTLARHDPVVFLEFNSWCLVASYDRSPRAFLDWLLTRFAHLYVWRRRGLRSVREMGAYRFLEDHMVRHRCLDDLVGVNDPARLRLGSDHGPWWHPGRFFGARRLVAPS